MNRQHWLFRLAMWAQIPGDDFEKPWAAWMLNHGWVYFWWIMLVQRPAVRLACAILGHDMTACSSKLKPMCAVCGRA